jgi:hypothetical protein
MASFFCQVERRFHDHDLDHHLLHFVLGTNPLSFGDLGSCLTTCFSILKCDFVLLLSCLVDEYFSTRMNRVKDI